MSEGSVNRSNRVASYQDRNNNGLYERIVAQRIPAEKRVIKAKDRRWEGNLQTLVDSQHGFEDRAISCFLRKISPGDESDIHRHSFEAVGYVVKGSGYEVHDGERMDWEEGDVVFIPANVWHQHVNRSKEEDAIMLLITNWPLLLHLGICTIEPAPSWEDALSRPSVYTDPFLKGEKSR